MPDGLLTRSEDPMLQMEMYTLCSEETGRVFFYPSNATSKYSYTVIVHHIRHEIFNNIVTITKMHQMIAFSCRFWGKCNFACKRPKSKVKMLIVRCTRNQMSWNLHHRTRKASTVQPWWSVRGVIPIYDVIRCCYLGRRFASACSGWASL